MENLESRSVPPPRTHSGGFTTPHQAVEHRVLRNIVITIVLGALVAALFSSLSFTLGTLLGGALSIVNFKWLAGSLRALFEMNRETGNKKTPPGTMMKLILRWLLIGAVSYGASRTGFFDAAGIVAGLLAPAAAIIVEAGYSTYKTLRESEVV